MIQRFKVSGNSMSPTLTDGRYVIGESLSYKFRNPKIGDLAVFKSPDGDMNLIKRITKNNGGNYFVEGDNKMHSHDSRDFGPISKNRIVARIIYG